jgi:7-carboxy-7-deazaguanine synthase
MLISEIYNSRQGEGQLTGTPSVFVRTSGCNLRCHFCDTPFASWDPVGEMMSVEEIIKQILVIAEEPLPQMHVDFASEFKTFSPPARHVVLTGGEPMLPRDVNELCEAIHKSGFHITIETAGTIDRDLVCDLMSISPKLKNSTPTVERVGNKRAGEWAAKHERARHRPRIAQSLIREREYQLKFVVESAEDLVEIESYLNEVEASSRSESEGRKPNLESTLIDRKRVMLMPEGIDEQTLARRTEWLLPLCEKLGFSFCPRRHIHWYGNKRAT